MDIIDIIKLVDNKHVLDKAKCSLYFAGGFIVGYGVKKALDSQPAEKIRNNTKEAFKSVTIADKPHVDVTIQKDDDIENDDVEDTEE